MPCRDLQCSCTDAAAFRLSLSAAAVTVTPPDTADPAPEAEAPEPAVWRCPVCSTEHDDGLVEADHPPCYECGDRIGCCCACSICESRGCDTRFPATDGGCSYGGNCGSRCSNHCRCTYCSGCDSHEYDRVSCDRCDSCLECCDCARCDNCSDPVDSTCDECNNCDSCCECSETSEEGDDPDENARTSGSTNRPTFEDRGLVFHRGFRHPRFPSLRYAAAEIEVAAAQTGIAREFDPVARRWSASVVSDGSLPSTGFEINMAPASGTLFVQQVEEMCEVLNKFDASVTKDCGLHVHLDFRHASTTDVAKATMIAHSIEYGLWLVVPVSRHNQRYCQSLTTVFGSIGEKMKAADTFAARFSAVGQMVYGETDHTNIRYRGRSKYDGARYSWWNVHSWFHRKTIEVRLHSGTTNATKIIMWASFFAHLLDRAQRMSIEDVEAFVAARGDGWSRVLALCPTAAHVRYFADRRRTLAHSYDPATDLAVITALATFNNTAATAAQE